MIKAAILGAESFGFGTAPMVALGCKYLRICHLNNCATGVATQNKQLRDHHFKGLPEMVIAYFMGVAAEVQQWLIKLGVPSLSELIGRTDLLEFCSGNTNIDLSEMLAMSGVTSHYPLYYSENSISYDKGVLNQRVYSDCMAVVNDPRSIHKSYDIYNTDRSVGATIAGEIAKNFGYAGREYPIVLNFTGVAGQSFGVWATRGMELILKGEANDYVGKGLAGGKLVIKQHNPNVEDVVTIMGNTCLYGATSGSVYANGGAGDRFAARNSGAIAVVEGIACNGCEYMTGGTVVILGQIDQNFGAGMTGGICYVWDTQIQQNLNHDFVEAIKLNDIGATAPQHTNYLVKLIVQHLSNTQSSRAAKFLFDIEKNIADITIIKPKGLNAQTMLDIINK